MKSRWLRFFLWGSCLLAVTGSLLYSGLKYFFSPQKIRAALEDRATAYIGLKTTARSLRLERFPVPAFIAEGLRLEVRDNGVTVLADRVAA